MTKKRFLAIGLTAVSILMLTVPFVQTRGNVSADTFPPKTVASLDASASNEPELFGIAAVSATDVWAVGAQGNSTGNGITLIEHWNGSSWKVVPSPNPSSYNNILTSVAADSATDVWTVGYDQVSTGYQDTLIEHWNGSSWKVVPSPNPSSNGDILMSVAAVSANDVWAVGYDQDSTGGVIEHWNGSSWKVVPSPEPDLSGVAAVSTNDVWAVGAYGNSGYTDTLVEHWNGSSWKVVPSPNPVSYDDRLTSVAAVSANDVWAVGSYVTGGTGGGYQYNTLIEHWNGNSWNAVPSPNITSNLNSLSGVAAVSTNDVWAVGYYQIYSTGRGALIEHWNGSSWKVVPNPNAAPISNSLSGVAAISTTDVWAVGSQINSTGYRDTLVEHWNGSKWNGVSTTQSQTNLPYPLWWSGVCDTNNYFTASGISAYTLPKGASVPTSYRGVVACGPRPIYDNGPDVPVSFFKGAWTEYEWECVELSMRYMYLAYGIKPYNANGYDVVSNYQKYNTNPILVPIANSSPSQNDTVPQPGDILSYHSNHTAVVTATNVNNSGNGTITVMEQNNSANGITTIKVGSNAGLPPWVLDQKIKNWLQHTVDLIPQSAPTSATVVVYGTGFAANEKVSIKFDNMVLTTVTATSNGTVSTTIIVPVRASLGTHHIQLVGQTSAFSPKTVFYVETVQ